MAQASLTPRGINYTHDAALKAYDDQMRWIDALDTKAGILMGADGIVAGLILGKNSALADAPVLWTLVTAALLFVSLVSALLAFGTRRYETAPDISELALHMRHLDDEGLRWLALIGLRDALDVNEPRVGQKAALLLLSGVTLLFAVLFFGLYFVYSVL